MLVEARNNTEQVLGPFNENTLTSIGTLSEWCGAHKAISMLLEAQEAGNKYSYVTENWKSILNLLQQMELKLMLGEIYWPTIQGGASQLYIVH